jgi:hypothetical protein
VREEKPVASGSSVSIGETESDMFKVIETGALPRTLSDICTSRMCKKSGRSLMLIDIKGPGLIMLVEID